MVSTYQNKSFKIGYLSVAVWKQFYGYGIGFIESFVKLLWKESSRDFS
jgi:hypothetical protein